MADGKHSSELIGASSFFLEWGHEKVASFQEVSGLEMETEVREIMQSTKGGQVVIIKSQGATPIKAGKITAKYAAFKSDPILEWRQQVVDGKMDSARKNCSVVIYGVDNAEIMRFNLKNAWPSKYSWSTLSSKSNEALQVTVVIEHEALTIAK